MRKKRREKESLFLVLFISRPHIIYVMYVYLATFRRELFTDIRKKTGGDFREGLLAFFQELPVYQATQLDNAMRGVGCNKDIITEVLCTATDVEIRAIQHEHDGMFKQELADRLEDELSGNVKLVFLNLLTASRGPGQDVEADVKALYKAGEGKLGTNKKVFIDFLTHHSRDYVETVSIAYQREHKHSLAKAIDSEFGGPLKKPLMTLATPLVEFYGNRLLVNFKRINLNETELIRNVAARKDLDLSEISAYLAKGGKSLLNLITEEVSNDKLKRLLINICTYFVKSPKQLEAERKAQADAELKKAEAEAADEEAREALAAAAKAAELARIDEENRRQAELEVILL